MTAIRTTILWQVRKLGVEADDLEIDVLFDSLDEDGGGTLEFNEIKHALRARYHLPIFPCPPSMAFRGLPWPSM